MARYELILSKHDVYQPDYDCFCSRRVCVANYLMEPIEMIDVFCCIYRVGNNDGFLGWYDAYGLLSWIESGLAFMFSEILMMIGLHDFSIYLYSRQNGLISVRVNGL